MMRKRSVMAKERPLIEAALGKAIGYGFATERLAPGFRQSITVEVMNRNFIKYHLGRGYALHRFTGVDLGPPHDHPCHFTTLILEPYIEERYIRQGGEWHRDQVTWEAGSTHAVEPSMVHKIVALPAGESWTLVRYGPHVKRARFYRFGDVAESRALRQRKWTLEA